VPARRSGGGGGGGWQSCVWCENNGVLFKREVPYGLGAQKMVKWDEKELLIWLYEHCDTETTSDQDCKWLLTSAAQDSSKPEAPFPL
jgi:hypothetical protein